MATKDISDFQVVKAVQDYQAAMQAIWDGVHEGKYLDAPLVLYDAPIFPYKALANQTGEPEKVCLRAMERADKRGLIVCGAMYWAAWLTAKGKKLLEEGE